MIYRRSVRIDEDNFTGIQKYRAKFMKDGKDKSFVDALNELLRLALDGD